MRLDAGSVLLLSGLVAWVTAPRDRREGVDIRAMQLGPFFPVGTNGLCPSQCLMDDDVLLCHHADGLSMLQLASCVKFNPRSFTVVELRSTVDICTCFLLDFVRLTANQEIITFTPKSCGQALLTLCNHMLPNRGKKLEHQGVAAGLVMEQSEAGWRKATRRHLAWLWNKISAIKSTASRNRYRALVIKTIKSVYWSDSGLKTGVKDRIVPFMLFKDGHLGPLYGGGRKGWYDAKDFKPAMEAAIAGSDWVHLHSFQTLVKEKIEYKEEQQGKIYVVSEESTPGPSQQGKKKETASVAFKPYLPENGILQRKTWFNKKRIAVIVFILCVVVGIVIMSCMYALLHSGGQFKRKKKSKGTKKNMFRRLSSMAGWDTEDEGDKNEPGEDRKESYGDRRPSQKPEPEEIKRRLSMPYSQWSPDDFELARELDEEKKDQAKRRTGSGQAEEEDARADLGMSSATPSEQKHGVGVHQKVPPEKEAEYREKTRGKPLSGASKSKHDGMKTEDVWTQVNIFDIVDEIRADKRERSQSSKDEQKFNAKSDSSHLFHNNKVKQSGSRVRPADQTSDEKLKKDGESLPHERQQSKVLFNDSELETTKVDSQIDTPTAAQIPSETSAQKLDSEREFSEPTAPKPTPSSKDFLVDDTNITLCPFHSDLKLKSSPMDDTAHPIAAADHPELKSASLMDSSSKELRETNKVTEIDEKPIKLQEDKKNEQIGNEAIKTKDAKDNGKKKKKKGKKKSKDLGRKDSNAKTDEGGKKKERKKDKESGKKEKSKKGSETDASAKKDKGEKKRKTSGSSLKKKKGEDATGKPKDRGSLSKGGKKEKNKKKTSKTKTARRLDRSQSASEAETSMNNSPSSASTSRTFIVSNEQAIWLDNAELLQLGKTSEEGLNCPRPPARSPKRHRSLEQIQSEWNELMTDEGRGTTKGSLKVHSGKDRGVRKSLDQSSVQEDELQLTGGFVPAYPSPSPIESSKSLNTSPTAHGGYKVKFGDLHKKERTPRCKKRFEAHTRKLSLTSGFGKEYEIRKRNMRPHQMGSQKPRTDCHAETDAEARRRLFEANNSVGRPPGALTHFCLGLHGNDESEIDAPETEEIHCGKDKEKNLHRCLRYCSDKTSPESLKSVHVCLGLHSSSDDANTAISDIANRSKTLSPQKSSRNKIVCGESPSTVIPDKVCEEYYGPESSQKKIRYSLHKTAVSSRCSQKSKQSQEAFTYTLEALCGSQNPVHESKDIQCMTQREQQDTGLSNQSSCTDITKQSIGVEEASPQQYSQHGDQLGKTKSGDSSKVSAEESCQFHEEARSTINNVENGERGTQPKDNNQGEPSESTSNKNASNQQKYPLVRLDTEESGDDVDFTTAFPALVPGSHSLFPTASEVERFVNRMDLISPTPFSELFLQFQKIEQEKSRQRELTADTNCSHRDVTPQTSNHAWTCHSPTEMSPSSEQSNAWDSSYELSTNSFSRTSRSQYTLGPRTPFSPQELSETSDMSCQDQTNTTEPPGSISNTVISSQIMLSTASSSRCPQSVRESRSSLHNDVSTRDVSLSRMNRKRTRSHRQGNNILFLESQSSLHMTQGSIK